MANRCTGSAAPYLRTLVAQTIQGDRHMYDEGYIRKLYEDYCVWIQDDEIVGWCNRAGYTFNYCGIEIAVADTMNGIINRFGEDQNYAHRVFLMFDGIHYDPLYMEPVN
ncbi:hypothetical protein NQ317_005934, partial [Molorchus minor]